jgi:hypothetical protein
MRMGHWGRCEQSLRALRLASGAVRLEPTLNQPLSMTPAPCNLEEQVQVLSGLARVERVWAKHR